MSVSTLLSTVTVQVREYVVPLYGSPTLPMVMLGGGTARVTERREGGSRGRRGWARGEQERDQFKERNGGGGGGEKKTKMKRKR